MPEMHLRQLGFTFSACGPFTKNKEGIQKFKEIEDSLYFYQNELDKACFRHGMAYGNFKDLPEEQLLTKYCLIKHLVLLKIQNMMDIEEVLLQWFINVLIERLLVAVLNIKIFQTKS